MRRRVVVTGIGCVTPSGNNAEKLWENLLAGRSGVGKTTLFDASNFPTKISAEVKDWSIADEGEDAAVWANRSRHTQFAAGAAKQAVRRLGRAGQASSRRGSACTSAPAKGSKTSSASRG